MEVFVAISLAISLGHINHHTAIMVKNHQKYQQ